MFCGKCGAPMEDNATVCGNCSSVVDVAAASGGQVADAPVVNNVQPNQPIQPTAQDIQYQQPGQYQDPAQQYQQPEQYQDPAQQYQQPGQYQDPAQQYQQPGQYQDPAQQYQQPGQYQDPNQNYYQPNPQPPPSVDPSTQKSKMVGGLLGIFVGAFGVHNFYLGYTGKAVAQLLITILTCGIGAIGTSIWGLIEGIMILTGKINTDGKGIPLSD